MNMAMNVLRLRLFFTTVFFLISKPFLPFYLKKKLNIVKFSYIFNFEKNLVLALDLNLIEKIAKRKFRSSIFDKKNVQYIYEPVLKPRWIIIAKIFHFRARKIRKHDFHVNCQIMHLF